MSAFLLTSLVFIFWLILGRSVLLLVPGYRGVSRELLAPVVGIAFFLLPVFWLSRLGLPVASFGPALFGLLLLGSVVLHWRHRSAWDWHDYGPMAVILGLAQLAIAWPMFVHGFDWLGFANNDMVNYSLLAQRFLGHGFFDVPSATELLGGRFYSQTFWLQGLIERPGSELLLASLSAVTGLHPTQAFMPLIMAAHLALISSLAALVAGRRAAGIRPARLALAALAVAPMLSFGTLYQLLGQTFGLGMLVGTFTTTVKLLESRTRSASVASVLLLGWLVAALLILYPELLPFLLVGSAAVGFVLGLRRPHSIASVGIYLGIAAALSGLLCLLLQRYLLGAMAFMLRQAHNGMSDASQALDMFQLYLLPSGVAGLWGLINVYLPPQEPWLSASIATGFLLLVISSILSLRLFREGEPTVVMFFLMLLVMAGFRFMGSSFALYKMVMYIQPFLWGSLALSIDPFLRHWRWITLPALGLGTVLLQTQSSYTFLSQGGVLGRSGSYNELHDASRSRLLSQLQAIRRETGDRHLISDANNLVLAKLQAGLLEGIQVGWPFYDFYPSKKRLLPIPQRPELEQQQRALMLAAKQRTRPALFPLVGAIQPPGVNRFQILPWTLPSRDEEDRYALLATTALQSPFNRRHFASDTHNFELIPWQAVSDHLIFIDSELGTLYYSHQRDRIAFYQLEADYFYPGQTMVGVGRHLLFQVLNPSQRPRLVLTMTASLMADGNNALPPVEVIGKRRLPLPVEGRGSARVISEPLEPQQLDGRSYLSLDFGRRGSRWKEQRQGLMRMFGRGIQADPRQLTSFVRDISLISETDYATMPLPHAIARFPDDLAQPNLEYSGIYEDGWVAEHCSLVISPSGTSPTALVLDGMIPDLGAPGVFSRLSVSIDGREIAVRRLLPGAFHLQIPVSSSLARRRIELRFSSVKQLPGSDRRPVAARLSFLGFRSIPAEASFRHASS